MKNRPSQSTLDGNSYYDNILLISPKGEYLSTISKKRANFYLKRNLGTEEKSIPGYTQIIRLNFSPKFITTDKWNYSLRASLCVKCGQRHELSLHHVVPLSIRRYFPEEDKRNEAGWCVLLCDKHHTVADYIIFQILKQFPKSNYIHPQANKTDKQVKAIYALCSILKYYTIADFKEKYPTRFLNLLTDAKLKEDELTESNLSIYIKGFDNKKEIKAYNKKGLKRWGLDVIEKLGGIEKTKEVFKNAFLSLEPKFLLEGYLQDHKK